MNRETLAYLWNRIHPSELPRQSEQGNFINNSAISEAKDQQQTNEAFSDKWTNYDQSQEKEKLYAMQRGWYLELYGFESELELANYLKERKIIFDAGCGLGYKAAWFAELAPESLVVGMDFSESARLAAKNYQSMSNLVFVQGDIASTGFFDGCIDYVSCDQVIMHTEDPDQTFTELTRLTRPEGGEFACYFYAKKALPRELIDDYFRSHCKNMEAKDLWEMADQLTELGKSLSELNLTFNAPDIPALGIKGGEYDLQRFIYWNFLKCFWSEELGMDTSIATNYDWYSPSNARRYSKAEVKALVLRHRLKEMHFHQEEACYSGRFSR